MTANSPSRLLIGLLFLSLGQIQLLRAEQFYVIPLGEIGFEEEAINDLNYSINAWFAHGSEHTIRYPSIDFETPSAEAYIALPEPEDDNNRRWGSTNQRNLQVAIKLADAETAVGKVSLASFGSPARVAYTFKFDPGQLEEAGKEDFHKIRKSYYARLASTQIPGGDWFRYQAGDAYKTERQRDRWRNLGQFDSSFNMFTGQRAVSENLALDRELILGTSDQAKPIPVDTIRGVTVEAIDWSGRITDAPTAIDPLAMVIPHDQHAAFFGSIKELNQVIDIVEEEGVSYFETMSNRKTYSGLAKKYQKQMGILIPDVLAEQLPVKSVAITGGDPFLPSGSDLCIIFETDNPDALLLALNSMVQAQSTLSGDKISVAAEMRPMEYIYESRDRNFSARLFLGRNFVAVSNSSQQAEKIRAAARGDTPSLGSLEEFKFFRQRYPLEDKATAFIFLSDATIRRWAGPEFRIGASRRVRAAAALGQATAQHLDGVKLSTDYEELIGELSLHGRSTVRSEVFNTLDFLTPIGDLKIEEVTPAEKESYERWRNGYENGWVRFDPIALSLKLTDDSLGLDLSVIPLRLNSDYDRWIATAGEATLDEQAMTPHPESIFMVSHAIDTSSESFRMVNMQSSSMLPGIGANPLAWVGGSLSVFADQDPFWEAMEAAEEHEEYIEDNLSRLPVGLRVSSKSPIKLALFLTTLRSFSEQAAPGLLVWETREFEETPYVVIRTTDKAGLPNNLEIRIHYAAMPDAFILSLNEDLLKRAITRNLKFAASGAEETDSKTSPYQAFAQTKIKSLHTYMDLFGGDLTRDQQFTSWAALPILNEWKQAFPERDPVQVHHDYFKETLRCPGGKGYQWNAELGSMESVAFGHPEAPREAFVDLPILKNWDSAKTAIGLKDKELRLEAELRK